LFFGFGLIGFFPVVFWFWPSRGGGASRVKRSAEAGGGAPEARTHQTNKPRMQKKSIPTQPNSQ